MFTELYLRTTNPKTGFYECFSFMTISTMLFSIIFHIIIYIGFFNLVSYIFQGRQLSNKINIRLLISLFIIMSIGFFGRFYHVKEIYRAYNGDIEKARSHIDKHYNTWVFLS